MKKTIIPTTLVNSQTKASPPLLTAHQAAYMAGVSRVAIHKARRSGKLFPSGENSKGYLYSEKQLKDWMCLRKLKIKRKSQGGVPTPHGVRGLYDRWAADTLKKRPLEDWYPPDLKELLDELKPIYLLCDRAATLWKQSKLEDGKNLYPTLPHQNG